MIFVRRQINSWNSIFCRVVSALLLPVLTLAVIWVVGTYTRGFFGDIAKHIMILFQPDDLFPIYLTLICSALILFALKLCLHDLVVKDGKDSVEINDEGMNRVSKNFLLSLATAPPQNYDERQWRIPRSAIRKIVVRISEKDISNSKLFIYHEKGVAWLRLMEWTLKNSGYPTKQIFKEIGKKLSEDNVKRLPLVRAVLDKNYAIEFQWSDSNRY